MSALACSVSRKVLGRWWDNPRKEWVPVEGYLFTEPGYEAFTFVCHRQPDWGWSVTEQTSGATATSKYNRLRSDAISDARRNLQGCNPKKFARMIAGVKRKGGVPKEVSA